MHHIRGPRRRSQQKRQQQAARKGSPLWRSLCDVNCDPGTIMTCETSSVRQIPQDRLVLLVVQRQSNLMRRNSAFAQNHP